MSNKVKKSNFKIKCGKIIIKNLTIISPRLSSKLIYKIHTKRKLNLKNPILFNEKLMYLKLNDYFNNEKIVKCSDKVRVRDYVKECGLQNILNELYGVYNDANEIKFNKLPNKFALKCNHGCGYNIICVDKDKLDIKLAQKQLNTWKNSKFGYETGETHYLNIKPLIIAERYIASDEGIMPKDYKIYCFNGRAKIILVCSERENSLKLSFFDLNWKKLDYCTEKFESHNVIKKPKHLEKMIKYAEKLSKPFKFVRVDFYEDGDKVIFGELTFTPARCAAEYYNEKGNKELGNMLKL